MGEPGNLSCAPEDDLPGFMSVLDRSSPGETSPIGVGQHWRFCLKEVE
jgi:hypothetical protein